MGELDFVSKVTGRRLGGRAGGCVGKKGRTSHKERTVLGASIQCWSQHERGRPDQ